MLPWTLILASGEFALPPRVAALAALVKFTRRGTIDRRTREGRRLWLWWKEQERREREALLDGREFQPGDLE